MNKKLFTISIPFIFIAIGLFFLDKNNNCKNQTIKSNNIEILFSYKNDIQNEIISLINNEKEEITIAAFRLTDSKIVDALINAKKNNVKITLLIDGEGFSGKYNKGIQIFKNEINVYIFPKPSPLKNKKNISLSNQGLMHHKFILFKSQQKILTGSYNFTIAAQRHNQENVVIIQDSSIYDTYKKHFDEICKNQSLKL